MEMVQIVIWSIVFLVAFAVISNIIGIGASSVLEKAGKEADKGKPGCLLVIIIIVVVAWIIINIQQCANFKSDHSDDDYWLNEPRHTQLFISGEDTDLYSSLNQPATLLG